MIATEAIAAAGVLALHALELGPEDLATVERCVPAPIVSAAVLLTQSDPAFAARWRAAGDDFVQQGEVLHAAIVWLLTPEPAARDPRRHWPVDHAFGE